MRGSGDIGMWTCRRADILCDTKTDIDTDDRPTAARTFRPVVEGMFITSVPVHIH